MTAPRCRPRYRDLYIWRAWRPDACPRELYRKLIRERDINTFIDRQFLKRARERRRKLNKRER